MTPASAKALYHIDEPAALLNLADELKKFITERKLTTPIQGKDYVQVEGWQYLGSCLGVMPVVEKVINLLPRPRSNTSLPSCSSASPTIR